MSFLLNYIPWYSYEKNTTVGTDRSNGVNKDIANTDENDAKASNDVPVSGIEMEEPTIDIKGAPVPTIDSKLEIEPNKDTKTVTHEITHHHGNITLYYSCDSLDLLNEVLDILTNETDNSVNSISGMFKWAFGTDKQEKTFQMCDRILTGLDRIMEIDTKVNIPDAGIRYARSIEYETSPDLNSNIIRRMKHNQGVRDIFRVLWIINWEFKLNLLPNWDSLLTVDINDSELIKVTKNPHKLSLYLNYLSGYRNSIQKAVKLRTKYYACLQQKNVINHIDSDFLLRMIELYKDIINTLKMLMEFKNSLNWMEEKRFDEYYKNRINLNLGVNFKMTNKYVKN